MNYYNEFHPAAAEWLRELIKEKLIPNGDVDDRSIAEVTAGDVRGYTQAHWFAGIGGWSLALQLAGVPSDTPLWTGSCPCPSFSTAGKGKGFDDPRGQLWSVWFNLIRECKPERLIGEQVANAVRHGWIDLVCSDLAGEGYAPRFAVLGAHSVGAPHVRQRLYWAAADGLGHADNIGQGVEGRIESEGQAGQPSEACRVLDGDSEICGKPSRDGICDEHLEERDELGGIVVMPKWVGHSDGERQQGWVRKGQRTAEGSSFWDACEWIECRDGKTRPVEPRTLPMATRVPRRVELLKGYGNALCVPTAATFIEAVMN